MTNRRPGVWMLPMTLLCLTSCGKNNADDVPAYVLPPRAAAAVPAVADVPEDLTPDEVSKIKIFDRSCLSMPPPSPDAEKLPFLVGGRFTNGSDAEVTSLTVEVQIPGETVAEPRASVDATIVKFKDFRLSVSGALLPGADMNGTGLALFSKAWAKEMYGYWIVVRSAKGFHRTENLKVPDHLFAAIARGDLATLKLCIDRDPSILKTTQRESGMGAVAAAAAHNKVDILRYLASKGADMDLRSAEDFHPIHYAARMGAADAVAFYLDRGIKADLRSKGGFTPLIFAGRSGNLRTIKLLLDKGAALDEPADRGDTPLCAASFSGGVEAVQFFLSKGANPNAQDGERMTPLMRSIGQYKNKMALALLAAKADVNAQRSSDRKTALHFAAANGAPDAVKLLLAHGANTKLKDSDGHTAYDYAVQFRQEKCVKLLAGKPH